MEIIVNKKNDQPLYVQIRDQLEKGISQKKLKPGDKLPSVAAMAKKIGVTQATVRRALEDLSKSGFTKCHVGRGTFIQDLSADSRPDHHSAVPAKNPGYKPGPAGSELQCAARRMRSGVSQGLLELMRLAQQPGLITFAKGIPDPGLLEPDFLRRLASKAFGKDPERFMTTTDNQGVPELRQLIAGRYAKEGVYISPDQVLITNGSQQAASIVAMEAAENGYRVVCETPSFQGIPETFLAHGNWVDTILRDKKGLLPEHLNGFTGNPHLLYTCPTFHNPIGLDMVESGQRTVAKWAKENKSLVVVDEVFRDLRFEGKSCPSMMSILGEDQTIIISSVSKTVISGLRVGWLVSSLPRVKVLTRYKSLVDQTCPPLMQGIVAQFFKSGEYDSHIKRIQEHYRRRRDVMLEALEQLMPQTVSWTVPQGGLSLWVTLPEGYSSIALLLSAVDKGINFLPGPLFDIDQRFVNSFKLCWSWATREQIAEGMEILADTVKDLLRRPPGNLGLSGLGNFQ